MYWWLYQQVQGNVWHSTSLPVYWIFTNMHGEPDLVDTACLVIFLWFHQWKTKCRSFARKRWKPLSWAQRLPRKKTKKLQREIATSCLRVPRSYLAVIVPVYRHWRTKFKGAFTNEVQYGEMVCGFFNVTFSLFHQTTSGWRRLSNITSHPAFLRFRRLENRSPPHFRSGCVDRQQVRSIDRNLFFFRLKILIFRRWWQRLWMKTTTG